MAVLHARISGGVVVRNPIYARINGAVQVSTVPLRARITGGVIVGEDPRILHARISGAVAVVLVPLRARISGGVVVFESLPHARISGGVIAREYMGTGIRRPRRFAESLLPGE